MPERSVSLFFHTPKSKPSHGTASGSTNRPYCHVRRRFLPSVQVVEAKSSVERHETDLQTGAESHHKQAIINTFIHNCSHRPWRL